MEIVDPTALAQDKVRGASSELSGPVIAAVLAALTAAFIVLSRRRRIRWPPDSPGS
ncbi:MAG: hypothetical protein ABJC39_07510 [Chloroflexota bacterium]